MISPIRSLFVVALFASLTPAQMVQGPVSSLKSPAPTFGEGFGGALAMDGTAMVVGKAFAPAPGPTTDVQVFRRGPAGWAHEASLTPPPGKLSYAFGASVAISGDVAVIGAPFESFIDKDGAAYVYRLSAGTWNYEATLQAPVANASQRFGHRVSIDGDRIAVSAPDFDEAGNADVGAVWTFDRVGATWGAGVKIASPITSAGTHFGTDLALDGKRIAVSSFASSAPGQWNSPVWTLTEAGGVWSVEQTFTPSPSSTGAFGPELDLDGDLLAIADSTWLAPTDLSRGPRVWHLEAAQWVDQGLVTWTGLEAGPLSTPNQSICIEDAKVHIMGLIEPGYPNYLIPGAGPMELVVGNFHWTGGNWDLDSYSLIGHAPGQSPGTVSYGNYYGELAAAGGEVAFGRPYEGDLLGSDGRVDIFDNAFPHGIVRSFGGTPVSPALGSALGLTCYSDGSPGSLLNLHIPTIPGVTDHAWLAVSLNGASGTLLGAPLHVDFGSLLTPLLYRSSFLMTYDLDWEFTLPASPPLTGVQVFFQAFIDQWGGSGLKLEGTNGIQVILF